MSEKEVCKIESKEEEYEVNCEEDASEIDIISDLRKKWRDTTGLEKFLEKGLRESQDVLADVIARDGALLSRVDEFFKTLGIDERYKYLDFITRVKAIKEFKRDISKTKKMQDAIEKKTFEVL